MDINREIENLKKEFENKLEKLKEDYKKEKNRKWLPNYGEEYFYLNAELNIDSDINYEYIEDINRFEFAKIFKTYDEAKEYSDYLKARHRCSYKFTKEEWDNDEIIKYIIYYDYYCNKNICITSFSYLRDMNTIYFKTREQAQDFIDKYKKQILKFEFGIEK